MMKRWELYERMIAVRAWAAQPEEVMETLALLAPRPKCHG